MALIIVMIMVCLVRIWVKLVGEDKRRIIIAEMRRIMIALMVPVVMMVVLIMTMPV